MDPNIRHAFFHKLSVLQRPEIGISGKSMLHHESRCVGGKQPVVENHFLL